MNKEAESDILIIGAGASGSIAARHLAEAGYDVVCLEQGDWVAPEEFYGARPEWELMSQKLWHPNPNTRGLPNDYPIDTTDSDVNPLMFNAVGGSTILYSAHWHRFAPSDFRVRTLDGVAEDWPFDYADLEPFYDAMDIEMGVSGLGGNPAYPPGTPPPLPPMPIGKIGRVAARGMNKLGWHWWPATQSVPSRPWRGRSQCARRGTCSQGCPEGAKASTDLTHWPTAQKFGARLITGARVSRILIGRDGRIEGALYFDRDGREHRQVAKVTVVCANGVGTPRLLLNSATEGWSDGLANGSGMVGRNLMMHPYAAVVGYFDEPMDAWMGPAGEAIESAQFYETDAARGFVRGAKWQVMPTGGPAGMRAAHAGTPLRNSWGENFHHNTRKRFDRSFEWGIIAEDLPDPENRVLLSGHLTDTDGIPAPRIVYRNSENTRRLIDFHVDRATEAMKAAGAYETSESRLMRDCGWHLMGTCRMGSDPATSVVNQWGQSHEIANLYILDGSTFVTSSGYNPTATIAAIALRSVLRMIETGFEGLA